MNDDHPVYRAGQGFEEDRGRSPLRTLLAFGLPALLLLSLGAAVFLLGRPAAPRSVAVASDPPGARVLVDLEDSGLETPCRIELAPDRNHLVQVSLPGHVAEPLAWTLSPAELESLTEPLAFHLQPQRSVEASVADSSEPAAAGIDERATTVEPPAATVPQVDAPAPAPAPARPSPARAKPASGRSAAAPPDRLVLENWNEAFRLRLDGLERKGLADGLVLPPGPHRIQVDAGGIQLLDTLLLDGGGRLHLPGAAAFVELVCDRDDARIVSGGSRLGTGRALVPRRRLPMEVDFEPLPGLLEPPSIRLDADAPLRLKVRYQEPLRLRWTADDEQGLRLVERGYFLPDRGFVADEKRGPERRKNGWHLGRAWHDRRPGGAHEMRFEFVLPAETHAAWPAELAVEAGDSADSFPLTLTDLATITILLNGVPIVQDIQLEDGLEERRWPVSSLLQPGINRVALRSSERARSWTRLASLSIEVGR